MLHPVKSGRMPLRDVRYIDSVVREVMLLPSIVTLPVSPTLLCEHSTPEVMNLTDLTEPAW